jgi:hypothetical protein
MKNMFSRFRISAAGRLLGILIGMPITLLNEKQPYSGSAEMVVEKLC